MNNWMDNSISGKYLGICAQVDHHVNFTGLGFRCQQMMEPLVQYERLNLAQEFPAKIHAEKSVHIPQNHLEPRSI